MNTRLQRSDLPELRKFLDNLPLKPCPTKLPEEYCKICRRLNGEVADYCETRILPPRPAKEALEEIEEPEIEEEEEEEIEEPEPMHRKIPILERPTYEEGDTSLEFVPSERSIEEARKSLPRFIPVHRGPRPFRPIEEPGPEEFGTFTLERPSIFKSPASLAEEEEMMFTLAVDEGAIEVAPLEMDGEGSIPSETVFESSEGIVEVVEVSEEPISMGTEEDLPVFQFIEEGEPEIVEAEIVEAEIVEEGGIDEGEEGIRDSAEEISGMTKGLEGEPHEMPPAAKIEPTEEIAAEKRPRLKKRLKLKKVKEKKPREEDEGKVIPAPTAEEPIEKGLEEKVEPAPGKEIMPPEEIVAEKRPKRAKLKRKLKLKKVKEKKAREEGEGEVMPEPIAEEPIEKEPEDEGEPAPSEEIMPSEEIETESETEEEKPEDVKEEWMKDDWPLDIFDELLSPEERKTEAEMGGEKPEEVKEEDLDVKWPMNMFKEGIPPEETKAEAEIEEEVKEEKLEETLPLEHIEGVEPPEEEVQEKGLGESWPLESIEELQPPEETKTEGEIEGEKFEEEIMPSEEIKFHVGMEGEKPEEGKVEEEGERKKAKKIKLKKKKILKMKKIKVKRSTKPEDEK